VSSAARQFTIVRLSPSDGALRDLLIAEAHKAGAARRHPFVELDATWCPPCQAIRESLDAGDARMVDAFAGTYIVQLDVDQWQNDLLGAGFNPPGIPAYFELDANGKSTGRMITGDAWGDNIPENMAPPLKTFFQAAS
jgi:thiol:disulfide interchange protein